MKDSLRQKIILVTVKSFLAMLSSWQLDHAFSHYVWESDTSVEVLRFFTLQLWMKEQDFWILCLFVLLLAVYMPEIYLILKYVREKCSKQRQHK